MWQFLPHTFDLTCVLVRISGYVDAQQFTSRRIWSAFWTVPMWRTYNMTAKYDVHFLITLLLPLLPASSLRRYGWFAHIITVLDPGWVLEVGDTAESRTAHFTSVAGEPVRKVKRGSQLCSRRPRSAVRLLQRQTVNARQGYKRGHRSVNSADHPAFKMDWSSGYFLAWLMTFQIGERQQINYPLTISNSSTFKLQKVDFPTLKMIHIYINRYM